VVFLLAGVTANSQKHKATGVNEAYVSVLSSSDESELQGLLVLGDSLRVSDRSIEVLRKTVVLVTPDVPSWFQETLQDHGWDVRMLKPEQRMNEIGPNDRCTLRDGDIRSSVSLSKVHLWGLTEFKRIMYLSPASLAGTTVEDLWNLEMSSDLAALPLISGDGALTDADPFCTSLMVISPSQKRYSRLLRRVAQLRQNLLSQRRLGLQYESGKDICMEEALMNAEFEGGEVQAGAMAPFIARADLPNKSADISTAAVVHWALPTWQRTSMGAGSGSRGREQTWSGGECGPWPWSFGYSEENLQLLPEDCSAIPFLAWQKAAARLGLGLPDATRRHLHAQQALRARSLLESTEEYEFLIEYEDLDPGAYAGMGIGVEDNSSLFNIAGFADADVIAQVDQEELLEAEEAQAQAEVNLTNANAEVAAVEEAGGNATVAEAAAEEALVEAELADADADAAVAAAEKKEAELELEQALGGTVTEVPQPEQDFAQDLAEDLAADLGVGDDAEEIAQEMEQKLGLGDELDAALEHELAQALEGEVEEPEPTTKVITVLVDTLVSEYEYGWEYEYEYLGPVMGSPEGITVGAKEIHCREHDIKDCQDTCQPALWIGNGLCDDGRFGADFNCLLFWQDGGDCDAAVDCGGDCDVVPMAKFNQGRPLQQLFLLESDAPAGDWVRVWVTNAGFGCIVAGAALLVKAFGAPVAPEVNRRERCQDGVPPLR